MLPQAVDDRRLDGADIAGLLSEIVGPGNGVTGGPLADGYGHADALTVTPQRPEAVVRPADTDEVSRIVRAAAEQGVPLTARGSGTGLSGACVPSESGVVVSFERMNRIIE